MRRFVTTLFILSLSLTSPHARIDLGPLDTPCSQEAVAVIANQGNILKAAQQLASTETLKNLAMTMITAGIVEGIFCGLDMSTVYKAPAGTQAVSTTATEATTSFAKDMETFLGHLNREAIRGVVSSGLSAATGEQVNIGRAAVQTVANALGNTLAGMAGDGLEAGTMNDFEHSAAHFGIGAFVGAVTNPDDPLRAAMVAGASAVAAHKMAEMMAPDKPTSFVTEEERIAYNEGVERAANLAKFLTPTIALLAGQGAPGVGASIAASATAVDYNLMLHNLLTEEEQQILNKKTVEYAEEALGESLRELGRRYGDVIDDFYYQYQGSIHLIGEAIPGIGHSLMFARHEREIAAGRMTRGEANVEALLSLVPGSKQLQAASRGVKLATKASQVAGKAAMKEGAALMREGGSGRATAERAVASGSRDVSGSTSGTGPSRPAAVSSDRRTLQALDLEDQSYKLRSTGIFAKKPIEWTAPNGTQQTYKIHQRTDIDWSMVRTAGPRDFRGKTNAEAARAGIAPQLPDGFSATLHHFNQNSSGKLIEASRRYHGRFGTREQAILHGIWGKNKPHPTNPVDHSKFQQETEAYWKWRVGQ